MTGRSTSLVEEPILPLNHPDLEELPPPYCESLEPPGFPPEKPLTILQRCHKRTVLALPWIIIPNAIAIPLHYIYTSSTYSIRSLEFLVYALPALAISWAMVHIWEPGGDNFHGDGVTGRMALNCRNFVAFLAGAVCVMGMGMILH